MQRVPPTGHMNDSLPRPMENRAGVLLGAENPFQGVRVPISGASMQQQHQMALQMNNPAFLATGGTTPSQGFHSAPAVNGAAVPLHGSHLLHFDLSPSNFTRAINFEQIPGQGQQHAQLGVGESDGLANQSIDTSSDLMEQQQAKEQAKLMQRFQMLRQQQLQQQQVLMMQQQQQLASLRAEQEKVQKLIAKQREATWGIPARNGVIGNGPATTSEADIPGMRTPKKAQMGSSVAQALAQGAMAMARRNQPQVAGCQLQGTGGEPLEPVKVKRVHWQTDHQPGLPLPNIVVPATPEEFRIHGNPDLDSDPDSRSLSTVTDDGVHPLPDTASESSDPSNIPRVPRSRQPASSTPNNLSQAYFRSRTKGPTPPNDMHTPPDSPDRGDVGHSPKHTTDAGHQQGSPSEQCPQPTVQLSDFKTGHQPFPIMQQTSPRGELPLPTMQQAEYALVYNTQNQYVNPNVLNQFTKHAPEGPVYANHTSVARAIDNPMEQFSGDTVVKITDGPLKLSDSMIVQLAEELGMSQADIAQVVNKLPISGQEFARYLQQQGLENDTGEGEEESGSEPGEEQLEDVEEEEEEEEEDEEDESEDSSGSADVTQLQQQSPLDMDERPIIAKPKTFEELLEEELKKEEAQGSRPMEQSLNAQPEPSKPRTFLRRGQGLARFSGKPPPPKVHRRAGQTAKPKSNAATINNRQKSAATTKPEGTKQVSKSPPEPEVKLKTKAKPKKPIHSLKARTDKASLKVKADLKLNKKPANGTTQSATNKNDAGRQAATEPHTTNQSSRTAGTEQNGTTQSSDEGGTPDDTLGETSFQQRMQVLEQKSEEEKEELDEFEILEKFADDNVSFLSNVSAVNRALKVQKENKVKSPSTSQEKWDVKNTSQNIETAVQQVHEDTDVDQTLELDTSDSSETETETEDIMETIKRNDPIVNAEEPERTRGLSAFRTLHRKVAPKRTTVSSPDQVDNPQLNKVELYDTEAEVSESQGHHKHVKQVIEYANEGQDLSSYGYSGSGQPVSGARTSPKGGAISIVPNDQKSGLSLKPIQLDSKDMQLKKGAKTAETSADVRKGFVFEDEEEPWGDNSISDDSAPLIYTKKPAAGVQQRKETSESDDEETSSSQQRKPVRSPVKKDKVVPTEALKHDDAAPSSPPTSKLVQKLFPKLREEKPKPAQAQQQEAELEAASKQPLGEGVKSKALRDKLAELEAEIERFREENAKLEKLRVEREEGLAHLKKEMSEFEKQKNDELKRLQEYKAEEYKKLRKERKVFEQYQKAMKTSHDKKEREEIEALRTQLSDLQEEVKRKEARWTASTKRLRDRIEQVENENQELKDEIKLLEKKRLAAWQKDATNKKKEESRRSAAGIAGSIQPAAPRPPAHPAAQPASSQPVPQPHSHGHALVNGTGPHPSEGTTVKAGASSATQSPPPAARQEFPESWVPPAQAAPTSPPLPPGGNADKKPIPRKRAFRFSISNTVDKGNEQYEEVQHSDGKAEKIYQNGAREILFSNGTRKQISADGQTIIVSFFNGDIKQIMPDQRVVYYYSEGGTTHTTYPDGLEILQFPNGQVEKHYPDGTKEITFPDQTIKYLFPNGTEESIFADGTVIRVDKEGVQTMEFPNGQREIHTKQYMRREYPDGTVKTIYPDGRQETKYSSGRLRVKDKAGNVLVDTKV